MDLETRNMTIKTLSSVYTCNYVFLVPLVNACLNHWQGGFSRNQLSIQVSDKRNFGLILHQQLAWDLRHFRDIEARIESWKEMAVYLTKKWTGFFGRLKKVEKKKVRVRGS